jgi:hypothetical protein
VLSDLFEDGSDGTEIKPAYVGLDALAVEEVDKPAQPRPR